MQVRILQKLKNQNPTINTEDMFIVVLSSLSDSITIKPCSDSSPKAMIIESSVKPSLALGQDWFDRRFKNH